PGHAADRYRPGVVAGDRGRLLPRRTRAGLAGRRARPVRDEPVGAPPGCAGTSGGDAAGRAWRQGGGGPRRRAAGSRSGRRRAALAPPAGMLLFGLGGKAVAHLVAGSSSGWEADWHSVL